MGTFTRVQRSGATLEDDACCTTDNNLSECSVSVIELDSGTRA
jgi:hypothetical protein